MKKGLLIIVVFFLLFLVSAAGDIKEAGFIDKISYEISNLFSDASYLDLQSFNFSSSFKFEVYSTLEYGEYFIDLPELTSLSVSGKLTIENEMSYLRVIAIDELGDEYMVFSSENLIFDKGTYYLSNFCEETCLIDSKKIAKIKIIGKDSGLFIENFRYSTNASEYDSETAKKIDINQEKEKIKKINGNNENKEYGWVAGETSISNLSYNEKKNNPDFFKNGEVVNFYGLDYYSAGSFKFPDKISESSFKTSSELSIVPETSSSVVDDSVNLSDIPSAFDWRYVGGQNWNSPIRYQGRFGACAFFATIAPLEAETNLYFNQRLDIDLSENQLQSGGCQAGYDPISIVDDNCFPLKTGLDIITTTPCSEMCSDKVNRTWIFSNLTYFTLNSPDSLNYVKTIKANLVARGPMSAAIDFLDHSVSLVGYYTYDGDRTSWIFKNSWGGTGEQGYFVYDPVYDVQFNQLFTVFPRHYTRVVPAIQNSSLRIKCNDKDSDGYCNWGLSKAGLNDGWRAQNCPASCLNQIVRDCDDSDNNTHLCKDMRMPKCEDSEKVSEYTGKHFYTSGNTSVCRGSACGQYFYDFCKDSINVTEYYCYFAEIKNTTFTCPGRCDSGKCVSSCGNNNLENPEICDGTNLNGKTCASFGFDYGILTCSNCLEFNTSQCVKLPPVRILYPKYGMFESVTELNYSVSEADICWYSLDKGITNLSILCGNNISGLSAINGKNVWSVTAKNSTTGLKKTATAQFFIGNTNPGAMIAHYKFDGNTNDNSGNNINGANHGGKFETGVIGSSIAFDGASYVFVRDNITLDNTNKLSITAWIYPRIFDGQTRAIISKRTGAGEHSYSLFFHTNNKLAVDIDGYNNRFYANMTFLPNEWYHIALVYNGSATSSKRVKIYINGQLNVVGSETSASIPNYASDLAIGAITADTGYFNGSIDDLRIYPKALTEEEVNAALSGNLEQNDTQAPYFILIPENANLLQGQSLEVQFMASDNKGISSWQVNDTKFSISQSGLLKNISALVNGAYYLNITVNDTSNNLNSTIYLVGVSSIPTVDNEYPIFSNYLLSIANNSQFDIRNYQFNSTITSTNGTAGIQFNNINYSMSNITSSFNRTLIGLSAGSYAYYFWAFGNGTNHYYNKTKITSYVIQKNSSFTLGLTATTPINYGISTNFAGTNCPLQLTCSLNLTNGIYGAGVINANYSTAGNQNYSQASKTASVTINKANPTALLQSSKGWNFIYDGNPSSITYSESNLGDGDLIYKVYRNGIWQGTSDSISAVGSYQIKLNTTGGQNYSYSSQLDLKTLIITSTCLNNDADNDEWNATASCNSNGIADCNDANNLIHPNAAEICNNVDDNCVNGIDESLSQSCGTGACLGTQNCLAGAWQDCSSKNNDAGVCAKCDLNGGVIYDSSQDADCSSSNINIASCNNNPDNNEFTFDSYVFDSSCLGINSCSQTPANWQSLISHECKKILCSADCELNQDCLCENDKCIDSDSDGSLDDYADYPANGVCDSTCGCDISSCSAIITLNDGVHCGECLQNSDCDDNLYCNGQEICSGNFCQTGNLIDCSLNNLAGISSCNDASDSNSRTYDFRNVFISQCEEDTNSCSQGNSEITHTCDIARCQAECQQDEDVSCSNSQCSGNDYLEYPEHGICLDNCEKDDSIDSGCNSNLIEDDLRCRAEIQANIPVNTGVNFISLPLILENSSIENITYGLSGFRIYSYDGGWKVYYSNKPELSTLKYLEPGKGYIFFSNTSFNIHIKGFTKYFEDDAIKRINVTLNSGWNLAGTSIRTNFSQIALGQQISIYEFDGSYQIVDVENSRLKKNKAYWVYTEAGGEWHP